MPARSIPGRLLAELIADQFGVTVPVAVGAAPSGRVPIRVAIGGEPGVPDKDEGYLLRVEATGAVLAGHDYRGALYAVSSFIQLVAPWGHQSAFAREASIRDWPALPIRWVHLYLPGRDQLGFARRYLRDFLLRYKYNGVVLEVGGAMRLESHPEISAGWRRTVREWYAHGETMDALAEGIPLGTANRFAASLHVGVGDGSYIEKDDVRQLAAWADQYGLEIVPEIQSLSHAYYIASVHREVAEDPDMPWPDSYCPSNPESYRILFDVMDEYIDVLKPKRVHIGHDEWRAGAFCSRCRGQDTGELYARDVAKIREHLDAKGIETWLWGDHFVDAHNRFGKRWTELGPVLYDRPDTRAARDRLAGGKPLHILNWSGEAGDTTFRTLGWPFIIGNFAGSEEKDWPGRVARSGTLGGEVSSWGAFEEFLLGKLQIPEATFSANLLWSKTLPKKDDALEQTAALMPELRALLAAKPVPSAAANPMRFEVQDLTPAFNAAPRGDGWDLGGLNARARLRPRPAVRDRGSVARAVRRQLSRAEPDSGRHGWRSPSPDVGRRCCSSSRRPPRDARRSTPAIRPTSPTSPRSCSAATRCATPTISWRPTRSASTRTSGRGTPASPEATTSGAPCCRERCRMGAPAVLWASEWVNPRPDVPIVSVTLVGTPGPSAAEPLLFGITAVAKPRVEDYR